MTGLLFIRDLAVVVLIAGVVGWACQRLRLSVVVGYLVAGMIIGPHTPPFAYVDDLDRVHTLAELGLVFLIFGIGLNLSISRLKRLGFSVVVATVLAALIVWNVCRLLGLALDWSTTQSLFVAGMLMVSSSAIISKVL
ncbi:MAG TPA: sodium:proton exchanger, partial [Verrucomicrobiales bacterium]|nr:sodium:proton exchanger [Verrucomicrobiales bacterium]